MRERDAYLHGRGVSSQRDPVSSIGDLPTEWSGGRVSIAVACEVPGLRKVCSHVSLFRFFFTTLLSAPALRFLEALLRGGGSAPDSCVRAFAIRWPNDFAPSAAIASSSDCDRGRDSDASRLSAAICVICQHALSRGSIARPRGDRRINRWRPSAGPGSEASNPSLIIKATVCVAAGWVIFAASAICPIVEGSHAIRARITGVNRGR